MANDGYGERPYGEGEFGGAVSDGGLPHTVAVENTADDWTEYAFRTDGTAIEKNGDVGSINDDDTIDGTTMTVRGRVWNGTDGYDYDGELVAVDWAGPRLRLTVDGTALTDEELDALHTPLMTQTASVTLTLEEEGELTVDVTDTDDNPLADATVTLSGAAEDEATTDDSGQVVFGGLEVADYSVEATKDGYFSATAEVAAGDFTSG